MITSREIELNPPDLTKLPQPDPTEIVVLPARLLAELIAVIKINAEDDLDENEEKILEAANITLEAHAPVTARWLSARESALDAWMNAMREADDAEYLTELHARAARRGPPAATPAAPSAGRRSTRPSSKRRASRCSRCCPGATPTPPSANSAPVRRRGRSSVAWAVASARTASNRACSRRGHPLGGPESSAEAGP